MDLLISLIMAIIPQYVGISNYIAHLKNVIFICQLHTIKDGKSIRNYITCLCCEYNLLDINVIIHTIL